MKFHKLIPPWVFMTFISANVLMFGASLLMGLSQLAILNVLSGVCCYIGFRLSRYDD